MTYNDTDALRGSMDALKEAVASINTNVQVLAAKVESLVASSGVTRELETRVTILETKLQAAQLSQESMRTKMQYLTTTLIALIGIAIAACGLYFKK